MTASLIAELALLGVIAGFLAGLLGIGGGMLMVPVMTFVLDRHGMPAELVVKIAIATSLATITFTSLASVRAHQARGAVRWDLVRGLAPGIVVGSMAGAQVAKMMPVRLLAGVFALFVAYSATQMLRTRRVSEARDLPGVAGMSGVGAAIGAVSAVVGAGGGFLSVPFMSARRVPMHQAVGTSAALGFPIALAGTLGYVIAGWSLTNRPVGTLGFLHLPALAVIATASVLTAPLGARVAHALEVATLKRAFAVLLYVLAAAMAWRALG